MAAHIVTVEILVDVPGAGAAIDLVETQLRKLCRFSDDGESTVARPKAPFVDFVPTNPRKAHRHIQALVFAGKYQENDAFETDIEAFRP